MQSTHCWHAAVELHWYRPVLQLSASSSKHTPFCAVLALQPRPVLASAVVVVMGLLLSVTGFLLLMALEYLPDIASRCVHQWYSLVLGPAAYAWCFHTYDAARRGLFTQHAHDCCICSIIDQSCSVTMRIHTEGAACLQCQVRSTAPPPTAVFPAGCCTAVCPYHVY